MSFACGAACIAVVLAIAVAGFALIVRTVHSPFGQVLKAVKENEPCAISLGYDADRYKLLAFVLSGALSGLAVLTHVEWFRSIGESVTIVTGFIFIVGVLAFRRGIVGEIISLVKNSKARA